MTKTLGQLKQDMLRNPGVSFEYIRLAIEYDKWKRKIADDDSKRG